MTCLYGGNIADVSDRPRVVVKRGLTADKVGLGQAVEALDYGIEQHAQDARVLGLEGDAILYRSPAAAPLARQEGSFIVRVQLADIDGLVRRKLLRPAQRQDTEALQVAVQGSFIRC
jgi:hypothetical protein